MFEPSHIREARRALGLTQAQLAEQAGVSQSFVAKLESGMLDPSLSSMKRISSALEGVKRAKEKKVSDVMRHGVISVSPVDSIKTAAQRMRARSISQLPVLSRGRIVGMITETDVLDAILSEKNGRVSSVMRDPPPLIAPSSSIRVASDLLKWWPIVLVGDKGRLVGIVSKSDLISSL